jgi:hypothetical protein
MPEANPTLRQVMVIVERLRALDPADDTVLHGADPPEIPDTL